MQLALYKGPPTDLGHKIAHWSVRAFTRSPYSHCEIVINGVCHSASARDGGVRSKVIDLTSGRWDVIDLPGYDEQHALEVFARHDGKAYDWAGIARFVLPFLPHRRGQFFCSELCAQMLGLPQPQDWTPQRLADTAR